MVGSLKEIIRDPALAVIVKTRVAAVKRFRIKAL
jgi:hypothetical protein